MRYAILTAAAAVTATFVPLPSPAVERWYSLGAYPVIQNVVTWLSSLVSVALLDVGVLVALGSWLAFVIGRWRTSGARAGLKAGGGVAGGDDVRCLPRVSGGAGG